MDKTITRLVSLLSIMMVTFAILITGCTSPTTTTPSVTTPVTIVNMVIGEPESLDPAFDYESAGGEIIQNVYETLVYYPVGSASTDNVVGVLAKAWDISADGKTYTFYLKDGVKFHDGTAFNASAVKYSFDRGVIMNQAPWVSVITPLVVGGPDYMGSNCTQADVNAFLAKGAFTVVNDTTFQIKLEKAYPPFLQVLTFYAASVISPSYDKAHGGYEANNVSAYMTDHTCGTGPLKLVGWDRGEKVTLEKNTAYYGTPSKCDKVVVKVAPEWSTRFLAAKKGEADIIDAEPIYANDILNESAVKLYTGNSTMSVGYIGFNEAMKPWDNKNVRKAFVESFDLNTYINKINNGYSLWANGPIPAGLPGYDASIPNQKYDPVHAKQLLVDAGFNKSNPTTVTITYNEGNDARKTACLMLKDTVEGYDLGITVDVQEMVWATFVAKNRARELPIFYLGWIADYPSADSFLEPFCYSQGYYAQRVGYNNSTIDALYLQQKFETDPAKKQLLCTQITKGVNEDAAYIWLQQASEFNVLGKDVKGYWYNPMNSNVIYYTMYK